MDPEKQKLLLSLVCSNRDLMALCSSIIKPSYFDASLKKTVKFLIGYFDKYKDVPKLQTIRAETGMILDDAGKVERADINYAAHEIEEFCRNRAVTEAIIAGPELLDKGDFGQIITTLRDAISVGLAKDVGINYFDNPEERLRQTLVNEAKISTGWPELDLQLGGGIGRQELLLWAASSGGGKSITKLNLARNLISVGLKGVYISLEMSEGVVSKRLDSMISRISQENLLREISKVSNAIERAGHNMAPFFIKRMPENRTNINHVRSYLQQLEQSNGFRPDFIVIDYVDIMGCTQVISQENVSAKDKLVTEEIRSLGFDYNCIMISSSQLNRSAHEAEKIGQHHIAGGITKINTSDYVIAIKQDDLMRNSGEINFDILKSRNSNGVGQRIYLGWDPVSLLITSRINKESSLQLKKKTPTILRPPDDTLNNLLNL